MALYDDADSQILVTESRYCSAARLDDWCQELARLAPSINIRTVGVIERDDLRRHK